MKILRKVKTKDFEIQLQHKKNKYTVQILDHRGNEPMGEGLNYYQDFTDELEAKRYFSKQYNSFIDIEINRLKQEKTRYDPDNLLAVLMRIRELVLNEKKM